MADVDDMENALFATLGKKPKSRNGSKRSAFDIDDNELLDLLDHKPTADGNAVTSVLDSKREAPPGKMEVPSHAPGKMEVPSRVPGNSKREVVPHVPKREVPVREAPPHVPGSSKREAAHVQHATVDEDDGGISFGIYQPSTSQPGSRRPRRSLLLPEDTVKEDIVVPTGVSLQDKEKQETLIHKEQQQDKIGTEELTQQPRQPGQVAKLEKESGEAMEQLRRERNEALEQLSLLERENASAVKHLNEQLQDEREAKTRDIAKLTESNRHLIECMKQQHAEDMTHTKELHQQELESLIKSQTHTKSVSDLADQIEGCLKQVKGIKEEMKDAHKKMFQEIRQQFEAMETRLAMQGTQQQQHMDSLVTRLDRIVTEREKRLEQDKLNLEQQKLCQAAQETSFAEEQQQNLQSLRNERESLQREREELLKEQQLSLAKYQTAQYSIQQDTLQAQELARQLILNNHELDIKRQQLVDQQTAVLASQQELCNKREQERETIVRERLQMESLECDLKKREEQVQRSLQVAQDTFNLSQQSLRETRLLQNSLYSQQAELKRQEEAILDKQKLVAMENITLLRERRSVQSPPTDTSLDIWSPQRSSRK